MTSINKRKKQKGQRTTRRRNRETQEPTHSVSWIWYAAVIIFTLVLFSIFIVREFDPIDRVAMAGFSVICVGLALLIVGTCKAVGNLEFREDSWIEKGLNALAVMATPRKRFGEIFYSRSALYVTFEKVLIAIVLPLGFVIAFLRPKQTWPAILWVGSGLLATLVGVTICAVLGN